MVDRRRKNSRRATLPPSRSVPLALISLNKQPLYLSQLVARLAREVPGESEPGGLHPRGQGLPLRPGGTGAGRVPAQWLDAILIANRPLAPMNRQQKKCLIATAGFHLLLILILVVGPGFFSRPPKPDNTQLLDVIPSTAVEAALNSGVKSAQPPPPAPPLIEPPPPVVVPSASAAPTCAGAGQARALTPGQD